MLRGPGWGELGEIPPVGVFRGKGGGQVGFMPRGHRLVGKEIVKNLEVIVLISSTAMEQKARGLSPGRDPLPRPARLVQAPRVRSASAHSSLHQAAGASSGRVSTGWGRSPAPPLPGGLMSGCRKG